VFIVFYETVALQIFPSAAGICFRLFDDNAATDICWYFSSLCKRWFRQ